MPTRPIKRVGNPRLSCAIWMLRPSGVVTPVRLPRSSRLNVVVSLKVEGVDEAGELIEDRIVGHLISCGEDRHEVHDTDEVIPVVVAQRELRRGGQRDVRAVGVLVAIDGRGEPRSVGDLIGRQCEPATLDRRICGMYIRKK